MPCTHAKLFQSCPTLRPYGLYVAHQAPLFMGFSRQEYWSGLPCPPPGHLPDPGIKPISLISPAFAGGLLTTSATREGPRSIHVAANGVIFKLFIAE